MEIEIPYCKEELIMEIHNLSDDDFGDEKTAFEKIGKIINELKELISENKADLNKKIAKQNGITAQEVINSPDFNLLHEELCKEFRKDMFNKIVQKIVREFNLTKRQAWAITAYAAGVLD